MKFCKNKNTGTIWDYDPALMAQDHFCECDKDGNEVGKANIDTDDLIQINKRLTLELTEERQENEKLRATVAKLTGELDLARKGDLAYARRSNLEAMSREELLVIAETAGIAVGRKRAETLVDEIMQSEFPAEENKE